MGQMSVQYTPVQVLQAARRAEAEGKMDYALQFYRHLVEHHGTTAEAQEAREGLFRIAEWRWGEARVTQRQEAVNAAPAPHAANHAPSHVSGRGSYAASAQQQHDYAPEPHSHLPQVIAREAAKAAGATMMQPYKMRYRTATIVAAVLSGVGWAVVGGGILVAALAAGGVVADVSAGGLLGLPVGVLFGLPAAVVGLVLIVAGQLALAVFESTNATLESLSQGHA
jgi:hypothetical protein